MVWCFKVLIYFYDNLTIKDHFQVNKGKVIDMRSAKIILSLTFVFILIVLTGCERKAEPIDLPSIENVKSIEAITIEGDRVDITESGQIETIMTALIVAEPIQVKSVNDQPTNVDAYRTININTVGESTVVYYYDKNSKHYIEQPYRGIYELEDNLEVILLQE